MLLACGLPVSRWGVHRGRGALAQTAYLKLRTTNYR